MKITIELDKETLRVFKEHCYCYNDIEYLIEAVKQGEITESEDK